MEWPECDVYRTLPPICTDLINTQVPTCNDLINTGVDRYDVWLYMQGCEGISSCVTSCYALVTK